MLPASTVALIIQGIQAAITAAPMVAEVVNNAKAFITSLFNAGLIDKATQDKVHAHVDAIVAAILSGTEAPEWTVEPDPV